MQHEIDVAADFFLTINRWLTNFFNIFFDIANDGFLCCRYFSSMLRMLLFDVLLDRQSIR